MADEKWNAQKAVSSIRGGVSRFLDSLPANRSLQEENTRLKEELANTLDEVQRLNEEIETLRQEANAEATRMLDAFLVQLEALRDDAGKTIAVWREKEQLLKDEKARLQAPARDEEE